MMNMLNGFLKLNIKQWSIILLVLLVKNYTNITSSSCIKYPEAKVQKKNNKVDPPLRHGQDGKFEISDLWE